MRLITCLILSMFLCNTAAGNSTGKFTFLGEGACAPFEGTLFDVDATAEIVTLPLKLKKRQKITTSLRELLENTTNKF